MRIDRIRMTNFRCFKEVEFEFDAKMTLIIGNNTAGKSSLLDAVAVALGGFMLGIPAPMKNKSVALQSHTRAIAKDDIRRVFAKNREISTPELESDCMVEALASMDSHGPSFVTEWRRFIKGANGRTNNSRASKIRDYAAELYRNAVDGKGLLPLIAYYGTGRLWSGMKNSAKLAEANTALGYYYCLAPDQQNKILHEWIRHFAEIEFVKGMHSPALRGVYATICKVIPGATAAYFSPPHGELFIEFESGEAFPFSLLSDGQRSIVSLVGDMAVRCAHLNQGLGLEAGQLTSGIVLIDEIDLNVHPSWQQTMLPALQDCFPKVQFIVTTHSPFIIQSLAKGCIINLDDFPAQSDAVTLTKEQGIEEISEEVMGVEHTSHSVWFLQRVELAKKYYQLLDSGKSESDPVVEAIATQLDDIEERFADNPAWLALLKTERKASLKR